MWTIEGRPRLVEAKKNRNPHLIVEWTGLTRLTRLLKFISKKPCKFC